MARLVVLALLVLVGCTTTDHPPPAPGAATVVRVIDGDTVDAEIDGRVETVRLLGIDTPETKRPGTPVECFGPEASSRLGELLPAGTPILLTRDVEARDHYGRLLAYIQLSDGRSVNQLLVADGYADTLAIEPNHALADDLAAAAAEARRAGLGLWGACGGNHRAAGDGGAGYPPAP